MNIGKALDVPSLSDCLYGAAKRGYASIVRALLDFGADPNPGWTAPLVGAVEAEHEGILKMLVNGGAVVSEEVLKKARMRAEELGLESMIVLLKHHTTKVGQGLVMGPEHSILPIGNGQGYSHLARSVGTALSVLEQQDSRKAYKYVV